MTSGLFYCLCHQGMCFFFFLFYLSFHQHLLPGRECVMSAAWWEGEGWQEAETQSLACMQVPLQHPWVLFQQTGHFCSQKHERAVPKQHCPISPHGPPQRDLSPKHTIKNDGYGSEWQTLERNSTDTEIHGYICLYVAKESRFLIWILLESRSRFCFYFYFIDSLLEFFTHM